MPIFENKLVQATLWPLSLIYGLGIALRNAAYDRGWLVSHAVEALVISVGNISVGGTGKTPVTLFLSQELTRAGVRVGILSRGYGRRTRGTVLVSRGEGPLCTPQEAGDEPYWLALRTRQAPVMVDEDRVRGGRILARDFGVQVILLDDGFQHRRLRRDLDLVLFDPEQYRAAPHLLPAGFFREPLRSLRRAHWLWISGRTTDAQWQPWPPYFAGRTAFIEFAPTGVWEPLKQRQHATDILKKARIVAVAGIARPARFFDMLDTLGADMVQKSAFRDHYVYKENDWQQLRQAWRETGADFVVTTGKDWIKLEPMAKADGVPVLVLEMGVRLAPERLQEFMQDIQRKMQERF